MSTTTQCPECGTRFKASQAQLEAYHGMVRCGHCHTAFNAIEQQCSNEQTPQLDLPIELEEFLPPPLTDLPTQESKTESIEDAEVVNRSYAEAPPAFQQKRRTWPWVIASLLLLTVLLAQALYFFRDDIAARLPGLKPALINYCTALDCTVSLPHNAELMTIDSSDLAANPEHTNIVILTATLRNHALYAQAYPDLELTLNDINDKPVARRTFHPAEYLLNGYDEKLGLPGSRESNVKINLDMTDLKAAGYRLLLVYPQ